MSTLNELKAELAKVSGELAELSIKKDRIEAELKTAERAYAQEALSKIIDELKALNLDPSEIAKGLGLSLAGQKQRKTRVARGTAAPKERGVPKYRNPDDAQQTWSGKGRKPGWVQTHLGGGGEIESLLIKD